MKATVGYSTSFKLSGNNFPGLNSSGLLTMHNIVRRIEVYYVLEQNNKINRSQDGFIKFISFPHFIVCDLAKRLHKCSVLRRVRLFACPSFLSLMCLQFT